MKKTLTVLATAFFVAVILCNTPAARAQALTAPDRGDTASYPYWIEMMQDPTVNFYDVQRAFYTYWENKEQFKGCGYKPFKRWEYRMWRKISPDGTRPAPDAVWKVWKAYYMDPAHRKNKNADWVEIGPKIMPVNGVGLGRLNAIAFHPSDTNIMWTGAPSGGLWKTVNGGNDWHSTTDEWPTLGVSSIAVDYTNPDILYIGTGDRDHGDAPGLGVYKTTDGGLTWSFVNTGLGNVTVSDMLIHPDNPQILLAATSGGLFRTTNGGANWTNVGGNSAHWKDICFHPVNPDIIYGTYTGSFNRSVNGGVTWTPVTTGLAGGPRGVIAVTADNPNVVYYALLNSTNGFGGLYRSTDAGLSFTQMSNSPNLIGGGCNGGNGTQGWYDFTIAVDPANEDVVFIGGVNIFRSLDKGQTWAICGHWTGDCNVDYVHADQHAFEYSPLNGRLYVGNDGGFYYTADGGQHWVDKSKGLAIGQVYKIGQSATVEDLVMNGYQDNGTSCLVDTTFRHVLGADGMECAIDPTNPLFKYGTYQYGNLRRLYNYTDQGTIAGSNNGVDETGAWVTPFIIHETDPNTIFIGYKNVWRSNNVKALGVGSISWTNLTGNLTNGYCTVLEQSPANPDIVYLVKENHKFYRFDNANAITPAYVNLSAQLPNAGTPTSVEAHPTLANVVYQASNKKIYKSVDKGFSWTDISGSLPSVGIYTIVFSRGSNEGLYIGTDIGVFYKDATLPDWVSFSNGLPDNGEVTELEIYYDHNNAENNKIKACTFGRGLWESPTYKTFPTAGFTSNHNTSPVGCPITFTDISTGYPTSWSWSFPGGTPASSNQQNPPPVNYTSAGAYDVQLIVSNSLGSDTMLVQGYINVSATLLPLPGFAASDSIFCSGTPTVYFTDTSAYCPISWQWSFQPSSVVFVNGTSAASQNPVVQFMQEGNYSVTLDVTNSNGNASLTRTAYIHIGGLQIPFTEDFESGSLLTKAWTIENPNNDYTWQIFSTTSNPPGARTARMLIYGTNTFGRKDRLITPPLDLSGLDHATLTFRHSYAQYQTEYSDTLHIYTSEDCGSTWKKIFTGADDGTGIFATHLPLTISYFPQSAADWCGGAYGSLCYVIPVNHLAGKKNVKISFECVSSASNNMYIDDISITPSSGIDDQSSENGLLVFPNPSEGTFNIITNRNAHYTHLRIFSSLGQMIYHRDLSINPAETAFQVKLSDYPKGTYYLEAGSATGKTYRKMIIL